MVSLLRNQLVTIEFGVESKGVHATTRDLAGICCVYWHGLGATQEAVGNSTAICVVLNVSAMDSGSL